jgi:hypothetical protein
MLPVASGSPRISTASSAAVNGSSRVITAATLPGTVCRPP